MDKIDFLIFLLPLFGVFDVASTLYADSLGYSLLTYEAGFFAQYFLQRGLLSFYIVFYVAILACMSFAFFYIKRHLRPHLALDTAVFFLLIAAVFYAEARLTGVVLSNFMFRAVLYEPFYQNTLVLLGSASFLICAFLFVFDELLVWLKPQKSTAVQ